MTKIFNNKTTLQQEITSSEADYYAFRQLPARLRHYLMYDCPLNMNARDILEAYDPIFHPWHVIEANIRRMAQEDHRRIFGGVHPSLDPPRRVW